MTGQEVTYIGPHASVDYDGTVFERGVASQCPLSTLRKIEAKVKSAGKSAVFKITPAKAEITDGSKKKESAGEA